MPRFDFSQRIKQLEKRKGGYFYLKIDAEVVEAFEKKRSTRLLCEIDQKLSYSCGLNHLGDGNYYIIVGSKYLKKLGKGLGEEVNFTIREDPNPLGVEIPESLEVLLAQDEEAKAMFDRLTVGKKRSLIYSIMKVKDLDKVVQHSLEFLQREEQKRQKKENRKS